MQITIVSTVPTELEKVDQGELQAALEEAIAEEYRRRVRALALAEVEAFRTAPKEKRDAALAVLTR